MTDNDKALVERLRNDAHMIQADGLGATLETAKQAADSICELITDIEAQAAEIAELKSWKAAEEAHHHKLRAEIERLERSRSAWEDEARRYAGNSEYWQTETERLREALQKIANGNTSGFPGIDEGINETFARELMACREVARAALGETK
jgi:cell division protein FtsB